MSGPPDRPDWRERGEQPAYSELMDEMLDEEARHTKARRLIAIDELAGAGARTTGVDIDETGLRRMVAAFETWDYTLPVLADPARFAGGDVIPRWSTRIPPAVLRAALPGVPTYLWVAFRGGGEPRGPRLRVPPRRIRR